MLLLLTNPLLTALLSSLLSSKKSPSQPDAVAPQLSPGSLSLLSSPLQHKANCQQAIHKTIQQFNQHLKADQFDRKTLQLIAINRQNDFALLR